MRAVSARRRVTLDQQRREQLKAFARSTSLPHELVMRAKILLQAAEGVSNLQVGTAPGVTRHTVGK